MEDIQHNQAFSWKHRNKNTEQERFKAKAHKNKHKEQGHSAADAGNVPQHTPRSTSPTEDEVEYVQVLGLEYVTMEAALVRVTVHDGGACTREHHDVEACRYVALVHHAPLRQTPAN